MTVPVVRSWPRCRERKPASTDLPMSGSSNRIGSRSVSRPLSQASTISATSRPSTGAVLNDEPRSLETLVAIVYAAYPESLHAAAGQSVTSHLRKLEQEGRVRRSTDAEPLLARWAAA